MAEKQQEQGQAVAQFSEPRLPWNPLFEKRFGDINVNASTWRALVEAIYPAAKTLDSVMMALAYCKARRLDPFKRPVHIVPVYDAGQGKYVDTVWPGISELRTTAFRTGLYAGCDDAVYGPDVQRTFSGKVGRRGQEQSVNRTVTFPEWCQVTVHRLVGAGQRVAVAGPKVYWAETYATMGRSEVPNEMWTKRPRGQLEKCAEAAALRKAFPEELGNEYAAEEMDGRAIGPEAARDVTPADAPRPTRDDYTGEHPGLTAQVVDAEVEEPNLFDLVDEHGEVLKAHSPGEFMDELRRLLTSAKRPFEAKLAILQNNVDAVRIIERDALVVDFEMSRFVAWLLEIGFDVADDGTPITAEPDFAEVDEKAADEPEVVHEPEKPAEFRLHDEDGKTSYPTAGAESFVVGLMEAVEGAMGENRSPKALWDANAAGRQAIYAAGDPKQVARIEALQKMVLQWKPSKQPAGKLV